MTYREDLDRLRGLEQVLDTISSSRDLVEIFRVAQRTLRELVPCDRVLIVSHNEQAQCFSVSPRLNDGEWAQQELVIPYSDTSLVEVLRAQRSIARPDLAEGPPLGRRDREILGEGIVSDLLVPILQGTRLFGILHLGSKTAQAFTAMHQALAEVIALFLSLAVERNQLAEDSESKKADLQRWRQKFATLFHNSPDPSFIADVREDLIYEANKALEAFTGYSAEELHGLRLSALFSQEAPLFPTPPSVPPTQRVLEWKEVALLPKKGPPVPGFLRACSLSDEEPLFLFLIHDLRKERQVEEELTRRSQELLDFIEAAQASATARSIAEILDVALGHLGTMTEAKYVSVHLVDEASGEFKLVRARQFQPGRETAFAQPWLMGISEGPYESVLKQGQALLISDAQHDPHFTRWRPIAEKLGYRSLISLPLLLKGTAIGVLNLFFDHPKPFSEPETHFLKMMAATLAVVVDNARLDRQSRKRAEQIAVINQITNSINSSLDLEEVIRTTALETKRVVDFDQATISLFDDAGDSFQIFIFATEPVRKEFAKLGRWEPLGEAGLSWVRVRSSDLAEARKPISELLAQLDGAMKSKVNVLLLSQNKYLGAFTLASTESSVYHRHHLEFLRQIAGQIATAIENARLFQEIHKRLQEFTALADVSQSINSTLDIDQVLSTIVKAAASALEAKVCTIRFVENGRTVEKATSSLEELRDKQGESVIEPLVTKILREPAPLAIENLEPVWKKIKRAKKEEKFGFGSYLGVPVLSRNKVIAILSVFWEEAHPIREPEIKLLSTIANQAASAIENARLYKETLRNTDELKRANEELENFVFTVSHDLKTPVVSIQGFASILLSDYRDRLDEEAVHYLERIQGNANQMEKLIEELLDLSRIGRVVNPFEEVDVGAVLEQSLAELQYQIEERGIQLVVPKAFPRVWCDRGRLVQVLSNLLSNAIKFMGAQSSPRIEVGWEDRPEEYVIHVKDNGMGIKPEYHEKIFGLFQGFGPALGIEGTGVGLTIVKRIVENHGGRIWVESEEGKGATFYFTLPKHPLPRVGQPA